VDWALNDWWLYGLIAGLYILIIVVVFTTSRALNKLHQAVDAVGVANVVRDGFPQHIEATWEDVGARGRFLTDLGGMSLDMKQEMMREFYKALNKPMPCTPAAGS